MSRSTPQVESIRCVVSDVDGVMSDGRIVYDSTGAETKSFHVRDGLAIKLWMQCGFDFAIITGRESPMVTRRANECGVKHVIQNRDDKWTACEELFNELKILASEVCYIGDDLPDVAAMRRVGLAVAPMDASTDARDAAHWVTRCRGGEGVLRETMERLLRAQNRWDEIVAKRFPALPGPTC